MTRAPREETLARVVEALRKAGKVSAADLGVTLGVSGQHIRTVLKHAAKLGKVRHIVEKVPGRQWPRERHYWRVS